MNFQDKLIEATADLRARATLLANTALDRARARANVAGKRVETLKESLDALALASRELNKVARRHASRFVKENTTLAVVAGKDVSAIARATYAALARGGKTQRRKTAVRRPVARKRTVKKAA